MTEWAYFLGGAFDLTKRPRPQEEGRYIRLAEDYFTIESTDPNIIPQSAIVKTQTYRLAERVTLDNGDIAFIYVHVSPPVKYWNV